MPAKSGAKEGRPKLARTHACRAPQKGAPINGKILQDNFGRPLGPILGPTSANLGSTWAQLGPSKPTVKPTWYLSCFWQGFKLTAKPPNNKCAAFLKVTCPEKSAKTIGFPEFFRFCTSQPFATLHPQLKPSKPKACLQMASWTPKKG